jgi:hypothetical protein
MKKFLIIPLMAMFVLCASAQENASLETAKAALKAHGGEKFAQIKNLVIRGSGTVTQPGGVQTIPITFAVVVAGEKYRFDLNGAPVFNFKQISDGQKDYSSMNGVHLPPLNLVGLSVLARIGEKGYVVSDLPEKSKKKKGFRVTTPQGFYTDFIVDEKTGLVKEYSAKYAVGSGEATTSVAIDKYRAVDGAMIHEKYSQRLEVGQFSSYGEFKAKEISINGKIEDDVFSMP